MNPAAAAATPHGKRDQSKLTKMNTKLAQEVLKIRELLRSVQFEWKEQIQLKPAIDVTFSEVTPQLSITTPVI